MRVLTVATIFPDKEYPRIGPWSKRQVDSIKKYTNIEIEVVVPRPYAISIKYFPFYKINKLPLKIKSEEGYIIHYPRFIYLVPKKIFHSMTCCSYSIFVSNYIIKNLRRPDIIHTRFSILDGYGVIKACNKLDVPLVFDIHGNEDFEYYNKFYLLKRKHKKTIDFAKKIILVAKWQVKYAIELGYLKEKLVHIPLGIDINKFKPRNKEKIRKKFGIKEQKIILFVGHLNKSKGVNFLINAISFITKKDNNLKNTRIVIIGEGSEKKHLMNLSKKYGINNAITFTGIIVGKDMLKWYSLADIFVLPSLSEGRPTVINEAMASECAIVASNVGDVSEQVKAGYNGLLVEPKNSEMLAEKICYLIDNEGEVVRMGKNSRKRIIEKEWTWEDYAKKVVGVYGEVLKGS